MIIVNTEKAFSNMFKGGIAVNVGEGGTCPTGYSPFTSDMSSGKVKTVPGTNTIPCQVISKTTPIGTCVSNGCTITV
jgi:hypothetical protein